MITQQSNSISDERNFRPQTLEELVDQSDLKETLRLMLDSAHQQSATLEHVVFYGSPGHQLDPGLVIRWIVQRSIDRPAVRRLT
jgi:Holliday junction resolvasome RuvABC ATP-dependent DNA helicase subunit